MLGVVVIVGGLLMLYAGLAQRRFHRRVQSEGGTAWALIAPAPRHPEYEPSAYRPMLRFQTDDGRPVEVFSPVPPTRRRPLVEGRKVLVHYEPDDPTQVVVHGERGRSDLIFIVVGLAAVVGAAVAMTLA